MSVWCDLNVNDRIRFKLTPSGEKMWCDYWKPYCGDRDPVTTLPAADKDGWREEQMWSVFSVIGQHLHCGMNNQPIETVIQVQVPDRSVGFE